MIYGGEMTQSDARSRDSNNMVDEVRKVIHNTFNKGVIHQPEVEASRELPL